MRAGSDRPMFREWSYAPVDTIAAAISLKSTPKPPTTSTPSETGSSTPDSSPAASLGLESRSSHSAPIYCLNQDRFLDLDSDTSPVSLIKSAEDHEPTPLLAVANERRQVSQNKTPANFACNLRHRFDQIGQGWTQPTATNGGASGVSTLPRTVTETQSPGLFTTLPSFSAGNVLFPRHPEQGAQSTELKMKCLSQAPAVAVVVNEAPAVSKSPLDSLFLPECGQGIRRKNCPTQEESSENNTTLHLSQSMPTLYPTGHSEKNSPTLYHECPAHLNSLHSSPPPFTDRASLSRDSNATDDFVFVDEELLPSSMDMERYSALEDERKLSAVADAAIFPCFTTTRSRHSNSRFYPGHCPSMRAQYNPHHRQVCGPVPVVREGACKIRRWLRNQKQRRQHARQRRTASDIYDDYSPLPNGMHPWDAPTLPKRNGRDPPHQVPSEIDVKSSSLDGVFPCRSHHPRWGRLHASMDDGTTVSTTVTSQSTCHDECLTHSTRSLNMPCEAESPQEEWMTSRSLPLAFDSVTRKNQFPQTTCNKEKWKNSALRTKRKQKTDKSTQRCMTTSDIPELPAVPWEESTSTSNTCSKQCHYSLPPTSIFVANPGVSSIETCLNRRRSDAQCRKDIQGNSPGEKSNVSGAAMFLAALTEKINEQNDKLSAMSERLGKCKILPSPHEQGKQDNPRKAEQLSSSVEQEKGKNIRISSTDPNYEPANIGQTSTAMRWVVSLSSVAASVSLPASTSSASPAALDAVLKEATDAFGLLDEEDKDFSKTNPTTNDERSFANGEASCTPSGLGSPKFCAVSQINEEGCLAENKICQPQVLLTTNYIHHSSNALVSSNREERVPLPMDSDGIEFDLQEHGVKSDMTDLGNSEVASASPQSFPSIQGLIKLFDKKDDQPTKDDINLSAALKWRMLISRSRQLLLHLPAHPEKHPDPPEEGGVKTKQKVECARTYTPDDIRIRKRNKRTPQKPLVFNDKIKLIFIGARKSGKSSIVHGLQQLGQKTSGTCVKTVLKKRRSTIGADVPLFSSAQEVVSNSPSFFSSPVATFNDEKGLQRKSSIKCEDMTFNLWDFPGGDGRDHSANHATQSMFFSSDSVFVLVWDMGANNPETWMRRRLPSDEEDDYFLQENVCREADRALEKDIDNKVLFWIDCIRKSGVQRVTVIPVATFADKVNDIGGAGEARRRCEIMKRRLVLHYELATQTSNKPFPSLFFGFGGDSQQLDDGVVLMDALQTSDVEQLRSKIRSLANGLSTSAKSSLGAPISDTTQSVRKAMKSLKLKGLKIVQVEEVYQQVLDTIETDGWVKFGEIRESLCFLSNIGEILYFETPGDESSLLSRFCLLCPKFLFGAVSCVVRSDLRKELMETRRSLNEKRFVSGQTLTDSDSTLWNSNSNCLTISAHDSSMLWQSMAFMRDAVDQITMHTRTPSSLVHDYLRCLFVTHRIIVPIKNISPTTTPDQGSFITYDSPKKSSFPHKDTLFLLPSLLEPNVPPDIWTYKTRSSWKTTIAHTWLFRESAAPSMMVTALTSILQNLSEKCDFEYNLDSHGGCEAICVHSVKCWKNGFRLDMSTESESNTVNVVNVFGHLVSGESPMCVASNAMTSGMRKLILSARGQVGNNGDNIWTGGYSIVMNAIKSALDSQGCAQVEREIVCPDCLADFPLRDASVWRDGDFFSCSKLREQGRIWCQRGHSIDASLVTGVAKKNPILYAVQESLSSTPLADVMGSVVIVGLWDTKSNRIRNVGSGFICDKKRGLVVTASHVLIEMESNENFGKDYFGLNGRAIIGVLPRNNSCAGDNLKKGTTSNSAVFRYMAEIVVKDVKNADACVLQITTKLENDVAGNGEGCGDQPEIPLLIDPAAFKREKLQQIKIADGCELGENVRIIGYNQGGESLVRAGLHIHLSIDVAKGYVAKKFIVEDIAEVPSIEMKSEHWGQRIVTGFNPREETVIICPTICGHSGGPCVNSTGQVIGVLSRADTLEKHRCYLVPSNVLSRLVKQAKLKCSVRNYFH